MKLRIWIVAKNSWECVGVPLGLDIGHTTQRVRFYFAEWVPFWLTRVICLLFIRSEVIEMTATSGSTEGDSHD